MKCKICNNEASYLFSKDILQKYSVKYYRCEKCYFLFTEPPYWLDEAYFSPFAKSDTGLVARPLRLSKIIESNIIKYFNPKGFFLDYGGGNGLMVRMMRDMGYDFYRYDKYAENIYSLFFDIADMDQKNKEFELVTGIEVAEHLTHPMETFAEIFKMSDSLFFTTYIQPAEVKDLNDWWYLSPFHGQHISFYHIKTLQYISEHFNKKLYTDNFEIHLMTSNKIDKLLIEPPDYILEKGPYRFKNKFISMTNRIYHLFYKPVILKKNQSLTISDSDFSLKKLLKQ